MFTFKSLLSLTTVWSLAFCLVLPTISHSAPALNPEKKHRQVEFVTQEFPPFSYTQENNAHGFAVDVINLNCLRLNWRCQIHFRPWVRAMNELKNGKYDAAFLLGRNASREQWLWFSQPVIVTEYGFFVHSSNPLTYQQVSDLEGYKIAVYGPSNTSQSLQQLFERPENKGKFKIFTRPDDLTGFRQLNVGRVDAVYSNKAVGQAMIESLKLTSVRYAGSERALEYYVAFNKSEMAPEIVQAFNQGLEELVLSGKLHQLAQSYGLIKP